MYPYLFEQFIDHPNWALARLVPSTSSLVAPIIVIVRSASVLPLIVFRSFTRPLRHAPCFLARDGDESADQTARFGRGDQVAAGHEGDQGAAGGGVVGVCVAGFEFLGGHVGEGAVWVFAGLEFMDPGGFGLVVVLCEVGRGTTVGWRFGEESGDREGKRRDWKGMGGKRFTYSAVALLSK